MIIVDLVLKNVYFCYNSKTLEWVNKKNLVLGLTQENLIENSVQNHLLYITCYIMSFFSEFSTVRVRNVGLGFIFYFSYFLFIFASPSFKVRV